MLLTLTKYQAKCIKAQWPKIAKKSNSYLVGFINMTDQMGLAFMSVEKLGDILVFRTKTGYKSASVVI